jgi:hypothetical protein
LRANSDTTTIDSSEAGNDAVARVSLSVESERRMSMLDIGAMFLKGVSVKDPRNALASGEFSASMLRVNTLLSATLLEHFSAISE